MKAICIIPVKGHSTRLPGKHKKELLGQPLFYYALSAALESNCFEEVHVSSDHTEILDLAATITGVMVDLRPESIRGDGFSAPEVAAELAQRLGGTVTFDSVCILNACCPLVRPFHLTEAKELFERTRASAIETVVRSRFDPRYHYTIDSGFLKRTWNAKRIQSNHAPAFYFGNGAFSWIQTDLLIRERTCFLPSLVPYVMEEEYSYDIDTQEDFLQAEAQLRRIIVQQLRIDPIVEGHHD